MNSLILVERNKGVVTLRINRPQNYNALNKAVVDSLDEILESLRRDTSVRALIVTGERNFAAGADIADMVKLTPQAAGAFLFAKTFDKLEALPIPTIAAICGYALGGGLELALACDIRIAAEDAQLGLPEINLGIMPGAGGTVRLPKLIGVGKAKELILTGRKITGAEGYQMGLVQQVVSSAELLPTAHALAENLAGKAATALQTAKAMLHFSATQPRDAALQMEAALWAGLFGTADQQEGMQAFIEKRKPEFNEH
ncbi:MAG: enoyl-CoA hydratase-related protein [Anaerolineaceae bacterium]|nr:enoyl-CoA hydratase-related protein [Anaerolineaceae bacterium]